MRQIYGLFLKNNVVNEANASYLLSQVDVSKKENHLINSLDLGSVLTSELAKLGMPSEAKKCNLQMIARKR